MNFNRTNLWTNAWREFLKNPIFGNGPLSYANKYNGYFPHNILLEVLCDFGIAGFLILFGSISVFLFLYLRLLRKSRSTNRAYFLLFSLLSIPCYLLYTTWYANAKILFTLVFLGLELWSVYRKKTRSASPERRDAPRKTLPGPAPENPLQT